MPERQHFHGRFTADAIVQMIVNAIQVDPAHAFEPGVESRDPNARLRHDEVEPPLQLLTKEGGCAVPVF